MLSSTFKEVKFSFNFLLAAIHYRRPFPFIPVECLQIKRKSLRNVRNANRTERQSFIPVWIDEPSGSRRGCFKINGVFADVTEGISPPSHRQQFIILKKTLEGKGGAGFILPTELMAWKGAQAQRKRTCLKVFNCIHSACILPETEGEAPWQLTVLFEGDRQYLVLMFAVSLLQAII